MQTQQNTIKRMPDNQRMIGGDPQVNVDKAINTFLKEFETKKRTSLTENHQRIASMLKQSSGNIAQAKELFDTDLNSRTTLERLQALSQSIKEGAQKKDRSISATQRAKEAFQKDIDEAKEAFDQEMALRHADVVKQYVGTFVQQIDHF
ncbi:hypothetical protein BCR41DRAFT_391067 [Lobosporangium transversale]|uniref:Uncharacterized protein n=1 Tax=Lobosporangium transversale TaxID=64571 RepID=A0A1Y2H3Q3_9FUNG|nr:hypothetical protein BCR41DRAFT_391067 [Lobosporangium transversale]ORZ28621.1 hypothetical protein BCR41DRAFT_391067 [Lobosporangium transversale]|eukprot:XP_021886294.1 hypothetical protein BCR41DRAFT_391067 [Lobosporangium transversale]